MTNTPLPWNLYFDHPDDATRPQVGYIDGADRHSYGTTEIATVFSCAADPRQKANAELIVRAVNAHEALVRVAELVLKNFAYAPGAGPEYYEAARVALEALKEPSC